MQKHAIIRLEDNLFIDDCMPKKIEQKVTFPVPPHDVYEALMDSKKHAAFTSSPARISRKTGGTFSAYDGYIEGTHVELVPDSLIVQKWRGSDWPKNHYSLARFELRPKGKGTELLFTQEDVPEDQFASIRQGWYDHYWEPMKEFFQE